MLVNRVFELRQCARLTQEELAARVGVTRQTIISLEKNKYTPSLELGFRVARIFGKRIEEVFLYEEDSDTKIVGGPS
jgi:putative transcriptional regulator